MLYQGGQQAKREEFVLTSSFEKVIEPNGLVHFKEFKSAYYQFVIATNVNGLVTRLSVLNQERIDGDGLIDVPNITCNQMPDGTYDFKINTRSIGGITEEKAEEIGNGYLIAARQVRAMKAML